METNPPVTGGGVTGVGGGGAVKPTILAFHGSGSNSTIHTVQLARLNRLLKPHFDIVSLEAPFPSAAGPGILPFFEGCGPYKRWVPPSEKLSIDNIRKGLASSSMPPEVESLVKEAVLKARGTGSKVVGLIGFSQGTRVVAGLMKGCEIRKAVQESIQGLGDSAKNDKAGEVASGQVSDPDWCDFSFAVSVCGSYPPPLLPPSLSTLLSSSFLSSSDQEALLAKPIRLPVLHLEGQTDEWAWASKMLVEGCYEVGEGKSEVRVCEMGHQYPQKGEESEAAKDWVMAIWEDVRGREG